jgi:hypothetical protein
MNNYGYWKIGTHRCGLQGVASTTETLPDGRVVTIKDPDNPAVMSDTNIAYALTHSRLARHDFNRLFPTLDADSQERLTTLIEGNPSIQRLVGDPQEVYDAIQFKQVTQIKSP